MRTDLRLLEKCKAQVKALQDALIAGEESGTPKPFDNDVFLKRMQIKDVG